MKTLTIAVVLGFSLVGWINSVGAANYADQLAAYQAMAKGDFRAAIPALKRLADAGDTQAQVNLGALYMDGIPGVLPQDKTSGLELLQKAAGRMNGEALAALGNYYLHGNGVPRDHAKAFDYLSKAVNNGVKHGKIGLAICYTKGWGTPQDLTKAFQLTKEAAMQKVPGAAFNLAYFYRTGLGVEASASEANDWYAKAAPGLIAEATRRPASYEYQVALGTMYTNGWGVPKDPKRAAGYYARGIPGLKQAAAAGRPNAYLMLGELSAYGWGMPKDAKVAENWYRKAVTAGDKEGEILLARHLGIANLAPPANSPVEAVGPDP